MLCIQDSVGQDGNDCGVASRPGPLGEAGPAGIGHEMVEVLKNHATIPSACYDEAQKQRSAMDGMRRVASPPGRGVECRDEFRAALRKGLPRVPGTPPRPAHNAEAVGSMPGLASIVPCSPLIRAAKPSWPSWGSRGPRQPGPSLDLAAAHYYLGINLGSWPTSIEV